MFNSEPNLTLPNGRGGWVERSRRLVANSRGRAQENRNSPRPSMAGKDIPYTRGPKIIDQPQLSQTQRLHFEKGHTKINSLGHRASYPTHQEFWSPKLFSQTLCILTPFKTKFHLFRRQITPFNNKRHNKLISCNYICSYIYM